MTASGVATAGSVGGVGSAGGAGVAVATGLGVGTNGTAVGRASSDRSVGVGVTDGCAIGAGVFSATAAVGSVFLPPPQAVITRAAANANVQAAASFIPGPRRLHPAFVDRIVYPPAIGTDL